MAKFSARRRPNVIRYFSRALSHRNYRRYAGGNALSLVGTWMQRVAIGWIAWELTESSFWVGLVAFIDLFPVMIIGLFAGAVADKINRLKLFKITQILLSIQAIIMWALSAFGYLNLSVLITIVVLHGIIFSFNQPVRLTMVFSLVDKKSLTAAIAINAISVNMARFIGPALAGLIILYADISFIFAANAVSFLLMVWVLSGINITQHKRPAGSTKLWQDMVAGVDYVRGAFGVGSLLLLLASTTFLIRSFTELFPAVAAVILDGGAGTLSTLMSSLGLGSILGGLVVANAHGLRHQINICVHACLLLSIALAAVMATGLLAVATAGTFLMGFALVATGILIQSLLQVTIPDHMRGRVIALYGMVIRGGSALGALFFGLIGEFIGLRTVGLAAAVLCAGTWIFFFHRRHRLVASLENQ